MLNKKAIAFALCISVLLSMLAGCAGGSPSQAQSGASQGTSSAGSASGGTSGDITLRFSWWGGDSRHQLTLETMKKYHELNPNITVNGEYQGMDGYQQKMMTQLAGKTAPDIIQVDPPWMGDLGKSDMLLDIKGNSNFDFSQFDQKILDSFCTVNGKMLGLPSGSNGSVFVANADFLERFNIDPATQFTWDTFIEAGRRIHQEDPEAYLTAWDPVEAEYFVEEYIRMKTGKPWITDDFEITASKEDIAEAYTVLAEIYSSGTSMPLGEVQPFLSAMDQNPAWVNGKVGGFVDWISKIPMWKSSTSAKITTMNVPIVEGGLDNSMRFRPAHIISINANSANIDESCKFLNWFLSDPEAVSILKDCRSAPTSKLGLETLVSQNVIDPDVKAALDRTMANPADASPFIMGDAEIFSFLMDEFQNVAYGNSTPEQAAQSLMTRTQEKLDALKAQAKK